MRLAGLQLLHRVTGFSVVLFLLFFAVTGMVLNHSRQLQLDKKNIDYEWLLDWYGIRPPGAPLSFQAGDDWISTIETRLYFNDRELPVRIQSLQGVVQVHDILVAAFSDNLLLVTPDGGIVEKYTAVDGLPGSIQKIGSMGTDQFIIATADGYYANDTELGDWRKIRAHTEKITWSVPAELPAVYRERVMRLYRGAGPTLDRVMLDLHSGRLLGAWKMAVVDFVSVLLIISSISGLWMWYKKKKLMAGI